MKTCRLPGYRHRVLVALLCALLSWSGGRGALALDLGTPVLSPPMQQEKFFDTQRLTTGGEGAGTPGSWEPQVGISHAGREDEGGAGLKQTTHRIHGEAGGKLNLLDNVSLTAVAKIPLYTHETRSGEFTSAEEGRVSTELMRKPGNISWRSELGVSLGKGMNLNLFYDQSTFGRVDRPGVDEREEKFGTRFIIQFK